MLCALTFMTTILSYYLTIQLLRKPSEENLSMAMDFVRGAFVFISPCALEGISYITSKKIKKIYIDAVEIIIGIISVLLTIILFFLTTSNCNNIPQLVLSCIKVALIIYPLKVGINFTDLLLELLKSRKE